MSRSELNMPELTDADKDFLAQIGQEQERDFQRAESELDAILRKCENGMCTKDDVFQMRGYMRFFGVDV